MHPFLQDLKNQYKNGSVLIKLIFINVAVFLLINILYVFLLFIEAEYFFEYPPKGERIFKVTQWLSSSSDLSELIFKPWTLLSYMFLHEDLGHVFFNMMLLYFSGRLFVQYLSEKKLIITYILGGLSGLTIYILTYNLFPFFKDSIGVGILGASASVMAILIAISSYVPNMLLRLPFIGNIKLKYIALFLLVMDFINLRQGFNEGGYIAHLGGAIFGFLFIQQLKKGKDFTLGFSRWMDYLMAIFKPRKNMKVVYKKTGKTKSNKDYNNQKVNNQKKVDAILDKISKSGYDSLSADEKAILFDASKK
ncbi:rhomboid family intramembrane serine protease [Vicingaceae bacterium]|nr:rhomboid family intramembrane serine protease [Vicingaceae bacterium]